MNETVSQPPAMSAAAKTAVLQVAVLLLLGGWAFWPTIVSMSNKWAHNPEYSHGYLVPMFSIFLLWSRRSQLDTSEIRPNPFGLLLIGAALALRWAASYFYMEWFEFVAVVPFVGGCVLLVAGWEAFRWAFTAIAFLAFMLPLPFSLEVALRNPLRTIGTVVSTYVMQTVGLPAISEGNVILVGDSRIGVTEACSGLSMLMVFIAFSTATVLLIQDRPYWEKILVMASAIPIAIIANVTRVTLTGLFYIYFSSEVAEKFFHDLAGFMMIPLALAILWFELWLVSRILIVEDDAPVSFGLG